MIATIIFFGSMGLVLLLARGIKKLEKREAQKFRAKAIEAGMRQEIADLKTQKDVANKLLREAGEQR